MNTTNLQEIIKKFTGFCTELNGNVEITVFFFKQFQNNSSDYVISKQTFSCDYEEECSVLKKSKQCSVFQSATF